MVSHIQPYINLLFKISQQVGGRFNGILVLNYSRLPLLSFGSIVKNRSRNYIKDEGQNRKNSRHDMIL